MIHRKTSTDDARGVGEALNEYDLEQKPLTVLLKHYVHFGDKESARMI